MSAITKSAKGELCLIRIPGICNHDRETTVYCNANGSAAGKGIGMKSEDELGAYGCYACHMVVDGQRKPPEGWTRTDVRLAFWEGHARTLPILKRKGLLGA
jgi:hypothetical protein